MTESDLQSLEVSAQRYNGAGVTTVLRLIQEIRITREKIIELENRLSGQGDLVPMIAAVIENERAAIAQIQAAVDAPVIEALQTEVAGSLPR